MNAVDLSALPPPEIIESLSYESILAALKDDLVARHPEIEEVIGLESEPAVKILEVAAYRELLLRARYNDEARALLLAFAVGADLDHIGVTYYQEPRLLVSPGNPAAIPPVPPVYETHADYRYRLSLKPESWSVAGPRDAFEFHALSADGQVKSASVTSPVAGTTRVYILSRTGNGVPDAGLLNTVLLALNGERVRPLSELIEVQAGAVVDYALDVGLILFPGAVGEVAIAAATAALNAYAAAHHKLDADINLSAIYAAAHQAGVKRVVLRSPLADIVTTIGQAPFCTGVTVGIDGVEA